MPLAAKVFVADIGELPPLHWYDTPPNAVRITDPQSGFVPLMDGKGREFTVIVNDPEEAGFAPVGQAVLDVS